MLGAELVKDGTARLCGYFGVDQAFGAAPSSNFTPLATMQPHSNMNRPAPSPTAAVAA